MRYRISATFGSDESVRARGWYEADTPIRAVKMFLRDNPSHTVDITDRHGVKDPRGFQRWPIDNGEARRQAIFSKKDPEQEREKFGVCAKCKALATWKFHYQDKDGKELTLSLCKNCQTIKNQTPIIKQAVTISGCKKRSAKKWRKAP